MQGFMITLLTCSVTMSALALFYMAITPLLARRYSEKGRYYAWLMIVIGFIIPFRPQFNNAFVKVAVPSETATPIIQIGNGTPVTLPPPIENIAISSVLPSISWWQIAVVVWLTGVIAFLAYHVIKHYYFVKMARRWSESITDERALTLLQSLKTEIGISKRINLYLCSSVGSPMMMGFFNPRILLPKTDLEHDELRFILKHELIHYKRKDLLYKYLVLIATAIHWFNPIIYLMVKAIDVLCEMSCDAEVVRSADANTRQHYSETIIGVVKYQSKLKTALSTNFYGGKKGMKKRIFSIMSTREKKMGIAIICAVLIVTIGTGFTFTTNTQPKTSSDFRWPFGVLSEQNRKNDTVRIFEVYKQYGLVYDKNADRLFYNGELVRYFEDIESDNLYKKWPFQDGNVDVNAVRNTSGDLVGVEPFNQQAFEERTSLLGNEIYALQITNSITISKTVNKTNTKSDNITSDYNSENSYYTEEMEQTKREILEQAYEIYQKFGLTYDKENDRLNYNGNLVDYFEDKALYRFFGHHKDGGIDIYTIRDNTGNLTGLEVRD